MDIVILALSPSVILGILGYLFKTSIEKSINQKIEKSLVEFKSQNKLKEDKLLKIRIEQVVALESLNKLTYLLRDHFRRIKIETELKITQKESEDSVLRYLQKEFPDYSPLEEGVYIRDGRYQFTNADFSGTLESQFYSILATNRLIIPDTLFHTVHDLKHHFSAARHHAFNYMDHLTDRRFKENADLRKYHWQAFLQKVDEIEAAYNMLVQLSRTYLEDEFD